MAIVRAALSYNVAARTPNVTHEQDTDATREHKAKGTRQHNPNETYERDSIAPRNSTPTDARTPVDTCTAQDGASPRRTSPLALSGQVDETPTRNIW
jgi:hypothetical protein